VEFRQSRNSEAIGVADCPTTERATAWGIPAAELTELTAKRGTAQTKLTASTGPDGSPRVKAECNTAFAELKSLMRHMKNHHFQKPELSDGDFTALGLAIPDNTRTPVPKPEAEASFTLKREGYMQALVHHGKRPYGVNGALLGLNRPRRFSLGVFACAKTPRSYWVEFAA